MKAKNIFYAAVGGPLVAARKVGERASGLGTKLSDQATDYGQTIEKAFDGWAAEGEKVVGRITGGKVVDEITAKVDLDQAKEQVSKLRDQLEDMLATWRNSFRPEKAEQKSQAKAETTPAKKPAAKKPPATTSATKKTVSTAKTNSAPKTEKAS